MATPEDTENCHHVESESQRCKVELEKFHFNMLRCYGVIKESFPGDKLSNICSSKKGKDLVLTLELNKMSPQWG